MKQLDVLAHTLGEQFLIQQLVRKILENASSYKDWSIQGLGFLRLYLSTEVRLHVWDRRFAFPNASPIHTHPWDFESTVVAGLIKQVRFEQIEGADMVAFAAHAEGVKRFHRSTLKCGAGNCERTPPVDSLLRQLPEEVYGPGETYTERADEIHYSYPEEGTVTLVRRYFTKADVDHADVFWPHGEEWGSAEPRPATEREVFEMTSGALERHFPLRKG